MHQLDATYRIEAFKHLSGLKLEELSLKINDLGIKVRASLIELFEAPTP